jgi:hypothetical protein
MSCVSVSLGMAASSVSRAALLRRSHHPADQPVGAGGPEVAHCVSRTDSNANFTEEIQWLLKLLNRHFGPVSQSRFWRLL